MASSIHVGDIGTVFKLTLLKNGVATDPLDLSTASVLQMIFGKPDGSSHTVSASRLTAGTDGVMVYATLAGDLDQPGTWKIQAFVTTPQGSWHSDVEKFKVAVNI